MNKTALSVIIISPPDSPTLKRAQKSVSWAAEVVTVHPKQPITDFSQVRNQALQKANQAWVLFLDSDEWVSPELASEIKTAITQDRYQGYRLPRRDIFLGKELQGGEATQQAVLRLARTQLLTFKRPVHEQATVVGRVGSLSEFLWHEAHDSISSFLRSINHYTDLEANYRWERHERFRWSDCLLFPPGKFVLNYVVRGGWRDGYQGLIYALLMSVHSLTVRVKLYEQTQKNQID